MKSRYPLATIATFLTLVAIGGCGNGNENEDYHLQSTNDLTLTAQNHPHGFTQTECFHCHVSSKIHQVDRLKTPLTSIARTLVDQQGLASCVGCHGKNGVN